MMQGLNPNGKLQMVKVDADGALIVAGGAPGGGPSAGTSNTTEATQLLVKAAVESINTKTPALSAGKVPVTDPTALPLPTGAATSALQGTANSSLASIDADLGAQADPAATSDAGTFSLIALVKRGLGYWTTLLARIPALVNTRTPVDTDRVTKQVIDAASPTVTYVCEAQAVGTDTSAAAWRIKRITVSGSVTTIQWGGTGAFDQIADNRATTVVYA